MLYKLKWLAGALVLLVAATQVRISAASVIFWTLHTFAVMFGFWMLIITVPLHLIYRALTRRAPSA